MTDSRQELICGLHGARYMVLAGPGCGKTHILARRVFMAHQSRQVPFSDMLCLTFTNRAAREMNSRIEAYLGYRPEGLYTGNIHRFCLQMLYENEIIHPDTSILDDDDFESYTAAVLGRTYASLSYRFTQVARLYRQTELDFPAHLRERLPDTPSEHEWEMARQYCRYKQENRLIDFDDILMLAYDALRRQRVAVMNSYRWIQIDEVQDISPLQIAIVDLLETPEATVMYLGDEQQAIFAFLGAGGPVLTRLGRRCAGNIYHLRNNYRSPKQLVDLCNALASNFLGIDSELMPESVTGKADIQVNTLYECAGGEDLCAAAAANARYWLEKDPEGSIAVLARTNREAQAISEFFDRVKLPYLLFSQKDIFRGVDFKTLWSHLAVCVDPDRPSEWARLLYQTNACRTLGQAREIMHSLTHAAVSGSELLDFGRSTMAERLDSAMKLPERTIVVLDTETTGPDELRDDIVQICALKLKGGKIVPGSRFEVFIETDRPLPRTVGGLPNPLLNDYAAAERLDPRTAMQRFIDYLMQESCIPAGHNIDFDLRILRANLRRRTSLAVPEIMAPGAAVLDSLRLSKMLLPHLRSYRLEYMLRHFAIDAVNSHNAIDDVYATALLLRELAPLATIATERTDRLRRRPLVIRAANRLSGVYGELFRQTRAQMDNPSEGPENTLGNAMFGAYLYFLTRGCIKAIGHFHYVLDLVNTVIAGPGNRGSFLHQLRTHLRNLLTYNEGDLYSLGIIRERLSIMTVHKAKGLEMDHVIVYDAANSYGAFEEYLRVLYVAFSRARTTLQTGISRPLSRGLAMLEEHFDVLPPQHVRELVLRGRRIPR